MATVVECVVAPGFAPAALDLLCRGAERKRNRELRVVAVEGLERLPRYVRDETSGVPEVRVLDDGSLVLAAPMLTRVRGPEDFLPAEAVSRTGEVVRCVRPVSAREGDDLVFAWHVAMNVRSNAMVLVKDRGTLAVGTGEQDRIGALEQAIEKYRRKYRGPGDMGGAVLASDGYFPFEDSVEAAARAGVTAIVHPGGGINDAEVIRACNEAGVSLAFAGERCFSHH